MRWSGRSSPWGRLADAAAGGLIVLAVGSLAARLCRQPVRRARLVVLTLLGGADRPLPGCPADRTPVVGRAPPGAGPLSVLAPDNEARTRARSRPPPARGGEIGADRPRPAERPGRDPDGRSPTVPLAPSAPVKPAPVAVDRPLARTVLAWACYFAVAAGLAVWWFLGQVVLWRLTRALAPSRERSATCSSALTGPGGGRVLLLESDRIALPFTFTWVRPVILLPGGALRRGRARGLRYVLAHEWSHVERARLLGVEPRGPGRARPLLSALVLVAAAAAPALPGLPGRRPGRGAGVGRRLCRVPRPPGAGRAGPAWPCRRWGSATGARTSTGGSPCSSRTMNRWSIVAEHVWSLCRRRPRPP